MHAWGILHQHVDSLYSRIQPRVAAHTDLLSPLCTGSYHLMAPKAEKQPAKKSVSKVGGAKSGRKKGSRKAIESYKIYIYKVKRCQDRRFVHHKLLGY